MFAGSDAHGVGPAAQEALACIQDFLVQGFEYPGLFRRDRPYRIRQREAMPVILAEAMGLRLDDLHLVHGWPGQAAVPQRQHVHAIEGAQVVDQRLPHDFAIV
jgi:hypothetical protein